MKKSRIFSFFCLLFILGVGAQNLVPLCSFLNFSFDVFYLFLILLFIIVLSIIFRKNKKIRIISIGAVFLILGFWRYQISIPKIDENHIANYNGQTIEFIGQVIDEPDVRFDKTKLTVGNIYVGAQGLPLRGKILINVPNFPEYHYADDLKIKCELQQPEIIEDFNYPAYLSVKGIYSVCYQPEYVGAQENIGTQDFVSLRLLYQNFRQQIINLKLKSKEIIDQSLRYPHSEVLSAMILGLRKNIPNYVNDDFSRAGISHIIAISGLHISIITLLLFNLFIAFGFKRSRAFWLSIFVLILFLCLIGFRASAMRAGIMGFLMAYALKEGRLNRSINALLLAACVLLVINPKLLFFDMGFQLSFLAVSGIIYLSEYIDVFLEKIKIPKKFEIRSTLTMTLSAQVMVLPLVVYYFGNLSIMSPLSNILVLPLLPFVMIIGFILIIAGFIFLPLASLLGYVLWLGIEWILLVARATSSFSYSLQKIDFTWILIIYMFLAWFVWFLKRKKVY
ncbi:MAG: ComEC/Rec2 family competence protein [Candidatus Kuenenbacteria bacterium]